MNYEKNQVFKNRPRGRFKIILKLNLSPDVEKGFLIFLFF